MIDAVWSSIVLACFVGVLLSTWSIVSTKRSARRVDRLRAEHDAASRGH